MSNGGGSSNTQTGTGITSGGGNAYPGSLVQQPAVPSPLPAPASSPNQWSRGAINNGWLNSSGGQPQAGGKGGFPQRGQPPQQGQLQPYIKPAQPPQQTQPAVGIDPKVIAAKVNPSSFVGSGGNWGNDNGGGQPAGGKGGFPANKQQPNVLASMQPDGTTAYASGGPVAAHGLASMGRGGDSMLVHMSPQEVGGLQSLARAAGGSLTRNPHTGLPEAGFLSAILPVVAGAALSPFITPMGAAAVVGAEEGIRNKSWQKGLAAGLGAYGGGGIGSALSSAGTTAAGEAAGTAATDAATSGAAGTAADQTVGLTASDAAGLTSLPVPDMSQAAALGAQQGSAGAASATGMAGGQAGLTNMGRGLGTLNSPSAVTAFGHTVGKMPFAMAAAPAIYEGMNPPAYHQPGVTPTKYWTAAKGYSSLYNPVTHGWNPGQFVDSYPGYADGGAVDPNAAAMAKYQSMITPGPAAAPPPPPAALNDFLASLKQQNHTYTPPQVAPPASMAYKPVMVGPNGQMNGLPNNFFGMNLANLYGGGGGRGRAGGGIVSLMDGGGVTQGPGDGTSDSIPATIDGTQPARLAKGEFVVPARIVSELGNGSSAAGSQRLYDMMHRVEQARKKTSMAGDSGAYRKLPA